MLVANRGTAHTFGYKPSMAGEWIRSEQVDPDEEYDKKRRLVLHGQAEKQTTFRDLVCIFSKSSSLVVARPQISERWARVEDPTRSLAAAYAVWFRVYTLQVRAPLFYSCIECEHSTGSWCDGCRSLLCTACDADVVQCRRCT